MSPNQMGSFQLPFGAGQSPPINPSCQTRKLAKGIALYFLDVGVDLSTLQQTMRNAILAVSNTVVKQPITMLLERRKTQNTGSEMILVKIYLYCRL